MNPYFKTYLKNAAIGITIGTATGATCGSGAGVAGLNSLCSGPMDSASCHYLTDIGGRGAASAGAVAGAGIGALIGATVYPAYKGLMGWLYPRVSVRVSAGIEPETQLTEQKSQNVNVEVNVSPP